MVTVCLDYCNSLLAGLPQSTLEPLQRVQNCAARLILNLRQRDHVTPALKQLHWLPIQARVQFKLYTLMHGIHNSHCPAYLSDARSFGRDFVNKRRTAIGCYHELCNSKTADQVWRACVLARWPCCLESTPGNCPPGTNTTALQETFKNIFIQ